MITACLLVEGENGVLAVPEVAIEKTLMATDGAAFVDEVMDFLESNIDGSNAVVMAMYTEEYGDDAMMELAQDAYSNDTAASIDVGTSSDACYVINLGMTEEAEEIKDMAEEFWDEMEKAAADENGDDNSDGEEDPEDEEYGDDGEDGPAEQEEPVEEE